MSHYPGPTLERLAHTNQTIYDLAIAATAQAVPPRIADAMARYMEIVEARELLAGLAEEGCTAIAFLGFSPLVQELLKIGDLDSFHVAGIYTDTPPREFYGYACPDLMCEPLENYVPRDRVRAIVAERDLGARFPGLPLLPERAAERERNWFDSEARTKFPELFAPARNEAIEAIDSVFEPGRTILFAGVYTYFNFSRYSLALRKKGWKTVYLCLNKSNTSFRSGHFDAVIHASGDIELFYALMAEVEWTGIYFQAWLGLHPFAAAAAALEPGRTVVEFNDLPSYIMTRETFDTTFEQGKYDREQTAIREILDSCKGAVFNLVSGGEQTLLSEAPTRSAVRNFHSYPCPDFFTSPNGLPEEPIRIGFAGSLSPSHLPDSVFGDVKLFGLIQELNRQGLEFHVFMNPYQFANPKGEFWDYFHMAQRNPLFRVHPGVEPDALSGRLASMAHYGSMVYRFPTDFEVLAKHFQCMVPTKFFSYLEAGLPVLISREFTGLCELVEEHGVGVIVSQSEIESLKSRLETVDHAQLCRNVIRYREANSMEARISELESLLT